MKIVTFAAKKGGVGKTTLTYNFGEWLANQENAEHSKNKVLLIDLDNQCNLSEIYKIHDQENTVGNIFDITSNQDVKFHHVKPNIDLLAGDLRLDKKEELIENRADKSMLLFLWFAKHREQITSYDYILIDTPPAFSTSTKNAIVVSHDVLSPITPTEHGYMAKFDLKVRFDDFKKEAVDYHTMQSYVTSNLFFVGNMVRKGYSSTKEFLKALQKEKENGDNSCIALIPEKELFNRSTLDHMSLSEMEQQKNTYKQNEQFFDELDKTFEHITSML